MSDRKPGLDGLGHIIAARMLATFIVAIGITMATLLVLMGAYGQAALGLLIFLFGAAWGYLLVRDFEHGKVLLPYGYLERSRQEAAFWIFFCLFCVSIPLLLAGTAGYLMGI